MVLALVGSLSLAGWRLAGALGHSHRAGGGHPAAGAHPTGPTDSPATTSGAGTVASATPTTVWRVAWGSTMAWGYGQAYDTTVREIATVAVGGDQLRIRISNRYGDRPLPIGAATVAPAGPGAALAPGVAPLPLTFSGSSTTAVPVGGSLYSDPVALPVTGGERLAVSVFISGADLMTLHPCCSGATDSYFAANGAGNLVAAGPTAFAYASPWARLVDAVDVMTSAPGSIVVLGDSITDGYNSTVRWPHLLQERVDMLPPAQRRAIVNEAITANTLTSVPDDDETKGGGEPGLSRLAADVLDQPGVSAMVVFLGTNDLWFGAPASQVISGLEQVASAAHQAGIRAYAITLLPRTTGTERWTPTQQAELEQVDTWLLGTPVFDGVFDLAAVVADVYDGACQPDAMFPPFDSGDHLHPNAAGDLAMANAINTAVLGMPQAPLLPDPSLPRPTPGCVTPGPGYPPPPGLVHTAGEADPSGTPPG